MRSCVRSATFCELAGVDATDHRAALADLPPIDSYSHAGLILRTNLTSPRTEIPIGIQTATFSSGSFGSLADSLRVTQA